MLNIRHIPLSVSLSEEVDGGVRYLAFWEVSGVTTMAWRPVGTSLLIMKPVFIYEKERPALAVVAGPVKPLDLLSSQFIILAC